MITMTIGVDLHKRDSLFCLLGRSRGFVRPLLRPEHYSIGQLIVIESVWSSVMADPQPWL